MKFNKVLLIVTSILILMPILVGALTWDILPEQIATHWGANGLADDWSSRAFAVFGLPMILLVIHWICIIITAAGNLDKDQSSKALNMVLWIIPLLSWFVNGMMYSIAFGYELNVISLSFGIFGILFILMGNYMPKTKQNRNLGIKIRWTLESEANWNYTHRLAGKVWFIFGILFIACVFVPYKISSILMPILLVTAILIPVICSYKFYQKEKKEGKTFVKDKKLRKYYIISGVILGVLFAVLAFIMFSGNIEMSYTDDSFTVKSTYTSDVTVKYDDITAVWYSEDYIEGQKVYGFNSAKLLCGTFRNEALENYGRYTYTGNNGFVIVETKNSKDELYYTVLGDKSFEKTAEIYYKLSKIVSFELTYNDDSLTITPSRGEAVTVKYSSIGSTQFRPDYIEGEMKSGFETNELMIGSCRSDDLGGHKRYIHTTVDGYIILEIMDGADTLEYIMFNADTLEKTVDIYDELTELIVS